MYFGWRMVALAAFLYMLMMGTTYGAFGLFVIPVSDEFDLSRANMNSALILFNIGTALLSPFIGRLLDRYPTRLIMAVSAILFGASFVTLGFSQSIWVNAAILVLPLGVALPGAGTLTMSVLLARWFTIQRGRAMVLAAMGMSVGSIVVTPMVGWLIEEQGWRTALMAIGVIVGAILLVLSALVRERPGPDDIESGSQQQAVNNSGGISTSPTSEKPLSVATILKMPTFWTVGLSTALAMGITQALSITFVPLGIDKGLSMMEATSLMSITGAAAIIGMLGLSVVADKIDRTLLMTGFFTLGALLNATLLVSHSYIMLAGCAVILGIAAGAMAPIFYALLADCFGTMSFGTVRGLTTPLLALFSAAIVRFAGEVYDYTGNYQLLFTIFVFAELLAALLMFATRYGRSKALAAQPAG
ncbi:hypothetical protein MB02_16595 [Croceicoccus estronivorus]|uniref:MFS transporter n=1 Tax=Croceicoccus estronivorus TaxID=1172626 RepID=UPI00082DB67A|nr:MFS transporter [Croceicoccus estronivorus]OCC22477.1 hypothetical protein MB02_16595 [Croceicoccus estronivorus]